MIGIEIESSVVALSGAVLELLKLLPSADPFVAHWPPLTISRVPAPRLLPVCRGLDEVRDFALPPMRFLAEQVGRLAPLLAWNQTYSREDFGGDFLAQYGWTELIGLRGPIASDRIACGFLMLGPNIEYPAHAHEAEELYVPISGKAFWQQGSGGFALKNPGTSIVHRSWESHAMRTTDQPLLAIYVWKGGDLAAKAKIVSRA